MEIEKWDHAAEKAWLWVKIPDISSSEDTDFYLYYDSTHADNTDYVGDLNNAVVNNVWDINFKLVAHMRDYPDTSHIKDSTVNANDGTKAAAGSPAVTVDGKICDAQDFNGINSSILIQGLPAYNTLSLWLYPRENDYFIDQSTSSSYYKLVGSVIVLGPLFTNAEVYVNGVATTSVTLNVWNHILIAHDLLGIGANFWLGRTNSGSRYFTGIFDEIHISNTRRDSAWAKASYESGRDHLLDFGSEEPVPEFWIIGVTKDTEGEILGSCVVWLFRTSDKAFVDAKISHAVTGEYSFGVGGTAIEHFVLSYKDGAPDVFGMSARNLTGSE